MSGEKNKWESLSRKLLNGQLSPAEQRELSEWLNSDDGAPLDIPETFAESKSALERRIYRRIIQKKGARRIVIGWLSAAGVALLLILSGIYYFTRSEVKQQLLGKEKSVLPVLLPGTDKAILTLNNGQQIALDSQRHGKLAVQGGTSIWKMAKGEISYLQIGQLNTEMPGMLTSSIINTLRTPKGGQYEILLPDGTKAWLNAASSITYPVSFQKAERVVSITGEVYFEVAKDKSRPFHVKVGAMDVRVLGTHFNINAYKDEPSVRTTLLEGSVQISSAKGKMLMRPGEQVSMTKGGGLQLEQAGDGRQAIAWKNGKFEFGAKSDIYSVMRQIARWYDVDVSYQGKINTHIAGSISRNVDAREVLKMLEATGSVHFKINHKKIIVMP